MKKKSNVQKSAARRRQQQHKKKKGKTTVKSRDSESSSAAPGLFPDPSDPSIMKYSGRMYLDPDNNTDLYFNVGLPVRDKQAYPVYEIWLQQYVSDATFNYWMDTLKKELCNAPIARPKIVETLLYLGTCCVFGCYNAYKQITFVNQLLKFNETTGQESTHDVRLVLLCDSSNPQQDMWKDSHGEDANRGAPHGINLVLKLPTEIQWPPDKQPNTVHSESNII